MKVKYQQHDGRIRVDYAFQAIQIEKAGFDLYSDDEKTCYRLISNDGWFAITRRDGIVVNKQKVRLQFPLFLNKAESDQYLQLIENPNYRHRHHYKHFYALDQYQTRKTLVCLGDMWVCLPAVEIITKGLNDDRP